MNCAYFYYQTSDWPVLLMTGSKLFHLIPSNTYIHHSEIVNSVRQCIWGFHVYNFVYKSQNITNGIPSEALGLVKFTSLHHPSRLVYQFSYKSNHECSLFIHDSDFSQSQTHMSIIFHCFIMLIYSSSNFHAVSTIVIAMGPLCIIGQNMKVH